MNFQQTDPINRRVATFQVTLTYGAALVLAACSVTKGQLDRGAETIRFAPRPIKLFGTLNHYYPDASKRAHETGEVILHFHISADGIAQEPFVADEASTGPPRLIDAAKKLYRGTRYEVGEGYRHEVTASVLFEFMPCGQLQQASGLDYYYWLCIPVPQRPDVLNIMPNVTP